MPPVAAAAATAAVLSAGLRDDCEVEEEMVMGWTQKCVGVNFLCTCLMDNDDVEQHNQAH
jgi:hypothetical protein